MTQAALDRAASPPLSRKWREGIGRFALPLTIAAMFLFFGIATQHFREVGNIVALVHAMSPLMVIASGLALVMISGKLDISVGSNAFLSSTIGTILMVRYGMNPMVACVAVLAVGALLGAVNGFVVVVMGVNPLIATLGAMIAFRGAALQLTAARTIDLADNVRQYGDLSLGGVPLQILVALAIVATVHLLHISTPFGRHLTAIGNGLDLAARLGLPVRRLTFFSFVLCGVLASVGGLLSTLQIGSVTAYMGIGLEFNAVAVVVVGGISLFGGRGSILRAVLLGALAFETIRNGLNHLAANPYAYRLVGGAVIFVAMYADALKPNWNVRR
jgi:ribose/xylose/arabinose/galactoside ABC-type transport system permease subunit